MHALQRVAVEESRLGVPLLFAMDVVHGYRTIFPVPLAAAASFDPELARESARIAAREATAVGLHWTFAPMVDVARDPRWGRVVEGAGEDPYLGAVMADATVHGLQGSSLGAADSLVACPKHFVAYGAALGGRDYDSADVSPRALEEVYFPPFRAAVNAGASTVMSAFNDVAGVPATASHDLLTTTLRERWGFAGIVVSDWNAIPELVAHGVAEDRAAAAQLALQAGVDMDMAGEAYAQELRGLVERGQVPEAAVDAAVRRVLALKEALGLFERPYGRGDPERERVELLAPEHRRVARALARESFVLLRNQDDTLPLRSALGRLAVVGPFADDPATLLGSWRAQGRPEDTVTFLAALREALPETVIESVEGCPASAPPTPGTLETAVEAARRADTVILFLGESAEQTGEARSRAALALPGSQEPLARAVLATGRPTVVVLLGGRPLAVPWLVEQSPALIQAWLPGTEGGPALAEVLLGQEDFSGRLPITIPRAVGQIPIHYAQRPTGRPASPDLAIDSARYRDLPIEPLFPFGHGLSTTRFEYSELTLSVDGELISVGCRLTNRGPRPGIELVQLYVHDRVARVTRPVQELRGFLRVPLAEAESVRVVFTVPVDLFAYPDAQGIPTLEPGVHEVRVGRSSADVRLRGDVTLAPPDRPLRPLGTVFSEARVQRQPPSPSGDLGRDDTPRRAAAATSR